MNPILFPEMPEQWHKWPCRIGHDFDLPYGHCMSSFLYEQYRRYTCAEVADTVFDEGNKEIFVHYFICAKGFIPMFKWFVVWPVLRRGNQSCFERRHPMQGTYPWEFVPDPTLCEVFNRPNGVWGLTQTYMLRAGGRTKEEAVANWEQCVVPFRRVLKEKRQEAAKR